MRAVILIIFLLSCNVAGQKTNEELQKEKEFEKLILESKKAQAEAVVISKQADMQTTQIISKAVNTISTLKSEVKELKKELYETKKALDSAESVDNTKPFKLSPISGNQENR